MPLNETEKMDESELRRKAFDLENKELDLLKIQAEIKLKQEHLDKKSRELTEIVKEMNDNIESKKNQYMSFSNDDNEIYKPITSKKKAQRE